MDGSEYTGWAEKMREKIRKHSYTIAMIIILILFFCLCVVASNPYRITIAVIDLKPSANLSHSVGAEISEKIRTHLSHIEKFEVTDKEKMADALNNQGFLRPKGCKSNECHSSFNASGAFQFLEKCGMSDYDAAIEIGNMLKVDKVVFGLVNQLADRYTIGVKVIDTLTAREEVADQISSQFEFHNLDQRIDELAARLAEKIPCFLEDNGNGEVIKGVKKNWGFTMEGYGEIKDMKDFRNAIQERMKGVDAFKVKGPALDPNRGGLDMQEGEMALIPAGSFLMGSNEFEGESPLHEVYLDAFYIDKYEVTNAQYKAFLDATGKRPFPAWGKSGFDRPDQPVIGISWEAANEYAVWTNKRLPTEAEWEKAARGGDGRRYPWGNEWSEGKCKGISAEKPSSSASVGSYPEGVSPYGCYDIAGNVWEWCADWFSPDYYYTSENKNPKGPKEGSFHVLRGGGWESHPDELRTTVRRGGCPDGGYGCAGFRCVVTAQAGTEGQRHKGTEEQRGKEK